MQKQTIQKGGIKKSTLTIGYYDLRGKAQVCRLLCQYLKVDYEDKLFSLQQWDKFRKQKTKNWPFPDLPFLQEGSFTITSPLPMCLYVIARFGDSELLGRNLRDKSIVDMYIWTIEAMGSVIALNCQKLTAEQLKDFKQKQWKQNVEGKLNKYEAFASEDNFFMGYLTIIDFSIYQLVRYLEMIFPGKMKKFSKLLKIHDLVSELPAIKEYQLSQRAVKDMCPSKLLKNFKTKRQAISPQKRQQAKQNAAQ